MSPRAPYGLHWFRRDLRLEGNPALELNLERHPGRVLGVFAIDRKFLARPDFSPARFLFFLRTLEELRAQLRARGGDLLFLDVGPDEAFPKLLRALERSSLGKPALATYNRDYEPFARARDERMMALFPSEGIEILSESDHLLFEPGDIAKDDGGCYQVYTPFMRRWLDRFQDPETNRKLRRLGAWLKRGEPEFALRWPEEIRRTLEGMGDPLAALLAETAPKVPFALPEAGHASAKALLRAFRDDGLEEYGERRDLPAIAGTSRISVYLKNGSLTVPQILAYLKIGAEEPDPRAKTPSSRRKYLQELVWREFYYHVLWHRPDVERGPFLRQYADLPWENDRARFERWREGRTGYPIVDAGMRQLARTGWMHNRMRMIVASFLLKDLLVDWRWGERHFMRTLLDGDLAPNNGGWQWAASTGCDPQPYFRVFNPTSQGEKFDPDGAYVRRWCPELADEPAKTIHEPRPDAIVDHKVQRAKAIAMFQRARTGRD